MFFSYHVAVHKKWPNDKTLWRFQSLRQTLGWYGSVSAATNRRMICRARQIPIHVLGMFPRVKVSESCSSATFRDTSFLGPRLMSACQRKAFVWVQYIERLSLRYSYPGLSLSLRVLLLPGVENWWTPEPQPLGFGDAVCVAGIWRYPILGSKIGCGPLESLPFFADYYSNPFQSAGRDPFWWVVLWIDRD